MLLLFFIVNLAAAMSPFAYLAALAILPAYAGLLIRWKMPIPFVGLCAALVAPYLLLSGLKGLWMILPCLMIGAGISLMGRRSLPFQQGMFLVAGLALLGLSVTYFANLFVQGHSGLGALAQSLAAQTKDQIHLLIQQAPYELPQIQKEALQAAAERITSDYLLSLMPGTLASFALFGSYGSLYTAQRLFKKYNVPLSRIPGPSQVLLPAPLVFALLFLSSLGRYTMAAGMVWGQAFYRSGYMVLLLLSIFSAVGLTWDLISRRIPMKSILGRLFLTAILLTFLGWDGIVVLTIMDSVLDLRNLSGKSLWTWLLYRVTHRRKDEHNG